MNIEDELVLATLRGTNIEKLGDSVDGNWSKHRIVDIDQTFYHDKSRDTYQLDKPAGYLQAWRTTPPVELQEGLVKMAAAAPGARRDNLRLTSKRFRTLLDRADGNYPQRLRRLQGGLAWPPTLTFDELLTAIRQYRPRKRGAELGSQGLASVRRVLEQGFGEGRPPDALASTKAFLNFLRALEPHLRGQPMQEADPGILNDREAQNLHPDNNWQMGAYQFALPNGRPYVGLFIGPAGILLDADLDGHDDFLIDIPEFIEEERENDNQFYHELIKFSPAPNVGTMANLRDTLTETPTNAQLRALIDNLDRANVTITEINRFRINVDMMPEDLAEYCAFLLELIGFVYADPDDSADEPRYRVTAAFSDLSV